MKLIITKNLVKNVYTANIAIDEIADTDTELFNDYYEPTIDIGGEITQLAATPVILTTLPSSYKKIPSQFPINYRFPVAQYGDDAQQIAELWVETISTRIETAMDALRAKVDDYSEIEEIII